MKWTYRACLTVFVAVLTFGSGPDLRAAADQRVLIWGNVTDREQQSPEMARLAAQRDRICQTMDQVTSHPDVNEAMVQGEFALNGILAQLGIPPGLQNDMRREFADGWEDFCNEDLTPEQATANDAFIIYSHCSMFMRHRDGGGYLAIWLRGDMNEAVMLVSDGSEAHSMTMNRDLSKVRRPVDGEPELIGAGRTTTANMNQIGGPRTFSLGWPPVLRDYTAYQYQYDYSSSLSGGMMGDAVDQAGATGMTQFPSLAVMTRVRTNGTAWISTEVPGVEIMHAFYNNFAGIIESQQGVMSFMGGMLRNQEVITSKGIPLEYQVNTSAAMGMRSTSTFRARNIMVIPARVDECVAALPPGTQELDLQGPPGISGPGVSPGAEPPGVPSGAPVGSGTQSEAGSGAVGQVQCADDLYADNMTLMVQRMLDNLGYDVGGLDGKLGVQTMIAISEFQAEKGHKVTGEPSPQLAGILSAEVDKQCGN